MAAVEPYATLKADGRPYSYHELKGAILEDFQNELSLDDVLAKYDPLDNVSKLILNEFPLIGEEDDKELLQLYIQGINVDRLRDQAIGQVTAVLHECGVGMAEIDDFIKNQDGMGLFQEFSITNRTAVADKNFKVDYKRIIQSIDANGKEIFIDIDVSNLDFEDEIMALKTKGTIRADGTVDITRNLVKDAMERMQTLYDHIRANFNEGIGNIRHPMNDFQPTFVQRYEDFLAGFTNKIFKNLPELFLSFLPGSPVMDAFPGEISPLVIGVAKRRGRDMKSIVGRIRNVHLRIIGVQGDGIGISALLENGLFFKLRTCESIIASQIRGMHRYVPLDLDEHTAPLALVDKDEDAAAPQAASAAPKAKASAAPKTPKPQATNTASAERSSGRVRKPSQIAIDSAASAASAQEDEDDNGLEGKRIGGGKNISARPFFDLYQGELLLSSVSNQEPLLLPSQFYNPVKVNRLEKKIKKLEMEHIVGVTQAALMFRPDCYAMTIFANLQIMSHDSNNGVASTPSIPEKLDFILRHPDVSNEMSKRTFDARLRYFLARLHAMQDCITDIATVKERYAPYSSYKIGLDRIIYFLTHGEAFDVLPRSHRVKYESMQRKSKQMMKKMQIISRDLLELLGNNNTVKKRKLLNRIVSKLRQLKLPDVKFEFVRVEQTDPLDDYNSFVARMNKKIDDMYESHRQNIVNAMTALADTNGMDMATAIRTPLETLLNHPKIPSAIKVFIKSSFVLSLKSMKTHQLPHNLYKGVISGLFQIDISAITEEMDRLGSTFFDPIFKEIMGEEVEDDLEDDEDRYGPEGLEGAPEEPERPLGLPAAAPERPLGLPAAAPGEDGRKPVGTGFTMGVLGSSQVVDLSIVEQARSVVLAAGKDVRLTDLEKDKFLASILYNVTVPFDNLEELLAVFGGYEDSPQRWQEIQDIQDELLEKQARRLEKEAEEQAEDGPDAGGGNYISHATEECYVYSEMEDLFNSTGDADAYDYLCKSWKLDMVEKEEGLFMTKPMMVRIAKKILTLMHDKDNDALSEIYLTQYHRHDEPELKSLLRMIYDYFTLQGIFVPMTRDERIMYSLEELLAECMSKKIKFMEKDGDEMSFDNAYANILCIQIFGKPITIMINDLSDGKLPIPYGIQNHLCHDPFYPETFTVTFNVLKCLTLALPQCVSLVTYVSCVNLLVGESFLQNLYTDNSFNIVERIHDSFFHKMKRMEINDLSGEAYYVSADTRYSNFFTEPLPDKPSPELATGDETPAPGSLVYGDETPATRVLASSGLPSDQGISADPGSLVSGDETLPALQPAENTPLQPASTTGSPAASSLPAPTTGSPAASPLPTSPNKESQPNEDYPPYADPVPGSPLPGAASGGTKRNRRYKQKTKRNQTLSKRFKKNRTRRLHGLYIRN